MNQAAVNFRDETAASENADYGKNIIKSSCGCGGDEQKINITRVKQ